MEAVYSSSYVLLNMEVLECKVCFENYESVCRKPRSLGCGHTFCSVCLEDMFNKGVENCPGCRRPIGVTAFSDLPINYSIMDLLDVVEHSKGDISSSLSETLVKPPQTSAGICEEHGNHLLFYCTTCNRWICRDCTIIDHQESKGHLVITVKAALAQQKLEALRKFDSTESLRAKHSLGLTEYLEQLQTGSLMLEKMSENVKKVINFSLQEQDRIKQALAEGEHLQLEIASAKQHFSDVLTFEEVTDATVRTSNCQESYVNWMTKNSALLMTLKDRSFFMKWLMAMMCTSEVRHGETRNPVMYAVQEEKGNSRFAAITCENGLVHLHSLKDVVPPSDGIILPYKCVYELVDISTALTFLELAWNEGKSSGKIYIRLGEDYTCRGHNFLLLCTGEQGPSYCNCHFHQIYWIGRSGEYIECGDYEKQDGTGGAALLEGLEYDGKLRQPIVSGTVSAKGKHKSTASMFKIYTKDSNGYFDKGVFGHVEKGMDILRKVVSQKNIQSIVIQECGVVIT